MVDGWRLTVGHQDRTFRTNGRMTKARCDRTGANVASLGLSDGLRHRMSIPWWQEAGTDTYVLPENRNRLGVSWWRPHNIDWTWASKQCIGTPTRDYPGTIQSHGSYEEDVVFTIIVKGCNIFRQSGHNYAMKRHSWYDNSWWVIWGQCCGQAFGGWIQNIQTTKEVLFFLLDNQEETQPELLYLNWYVDYIWINQSCGILIPQTRISAHVKVRLLYINCNKHFERDGTFGTSWNTLNVLNITIRLH